MATPVKMGTLRFSCSQFKALIRALRTSLLHEIIQSTCHSNTKNLLSLVCMDCTFAGVDEE
jgi:hypothetical protein